MTAIRYLPSAICHLVFAICNPRSRAQGRPPPWKNSYVLYDAQCGLCSWAKRWLMQQPALIHLSFIPAGSVLAERLFPGLSHPDEPPEELVVVNDEGGVYREGNAWIMCLFALEEYRDWANRLAHPLLRPLARQGFALLSRQRSRISRWLSLASELEIAQTLRQVSAPACAPNPLGALDRPLPTRPTDQDRQGAVRGSLANHDATSLEHP